MVNPVASKAVALVAVSEVMLVLVVLLAVVLVVHPLNHQASHHLAVDSVEMPDLVVVLASVVPDLVVVLAFNHHHHHLNQAHSEVELVLVLVLVDSMLLVLLSEVLTATMMEALIVVNSLASINKVYKSII